MIDSDKKMRSHIRYSNRKTHETMLALKRRSALLIGDRRFTKKGLDYFTEGPKGPETGERYLRWFDAVTVVGREGFAQNTDTSRQNKICEAGLSVALLPNFSGLKAKLTNERRAINALKELISGHDAIIARMPTELGLLAIGLGLEAGKPVAVDLGGCPFDGLRAHGSIRGWLYAPISFRRVKAAISKCAWVSYVTENYLQARYPAAAGATIVACSNVDLPDFDSEILKTRIAGIVKRSKPLVFGTIGSLYGKFKGIQHALAAFGRIKDELPSFEYRVLGGGEPAPWRALAARNGLQDQVHFDGTLPAGQPVFEWLDGIDVYVHPSLREGVPRAVIEAMGRGCPVIASNVAGTPELLPDEVFHDPGDVNRLCELILQARKPAFREATARRNFAAAKNYTHDKLLARRDAFWGAFAAEAAAQKHCRARGS